MKRFKSSQALQKERDVFRKRKLTVGFVPTMGALHAGHLSLIKKAKSECDRVVVSIFVNPTQFGAGEDFKKYPRKMARDLTLLKKEKVDAVFTPSVTEVYPKGPQFEVRPIEENSGWRLDQAYCGKFRPGHFAGVLTVVAKLFHIVCPQVAYFGAKDYQQVTLIKQMTRNLNFGIKIRTCPIVREKDGLAMSSRNAYLSSKERIKALVIAQSLADLKKDLKRQGKGDVTSLLRNVRKKMARSVDKVQYLELAHPETLRPIRKIEKKMIALAACFVGKTRLIDNVIISV